MAKIEKPQSHALTIDAVRTAVTLTHDRRARRTVTATVVINEWVEARNAFVEGRKRENGRSDVRPRERERPSSDNEEATTIGIANLPVRLFRADLAEMERNEAGGGRMSIRVENTYMEIRH